MKLGQLYVVFTMAFLSGILFEYLFNAEVFSTIWFLILAFLSINAYVIILFTMSFEFNRKKKVYVMKAVGIILAAIYFYLIFSL